MLRRLTGAFAGLLSLWLGCSGADTWSDAQRLFTTGRFREAAGHYEQVVRLRPESPDAHYNLGLALARSGEVARALPYFAEALRRKPDPAAFLYYARFLATSGLKAEALASVETALRLRPNFPEAQAERDRLRALPDAPTSPAPPPR